MQNNTSLPGRGMINRNRNRFLLNIPVHQGAGYRFAYHQYKCHGDHGVNQCKLILINIDSRSKITRDAKLYFALLNAL